MWAFSETEIIAALGEYFWVFCRIGAFFLVAPILGTQLVSPRVRLILSGLVTFLLVPLLPAPTIQASLNLPILIIVAEQVLIGLAMGFVLQILFQVFVLMGQFVAMKMGLGFASMNDPSNGVSVTVLSQFYLMITTLLFLSINGHLLMIQSIVQSFTTLPVASTGLSAAGLFRIASLGSWMFQGALVMALPVLTSLLVVNIAFGVMSRAAQQMNVFTVGFPITLLFGMVLIYLSLENFLPNFLTYVDQGFQTMIDLANPVQI